MCHIGISLKNKTDKHMQIIVFIGHKKGPQRKFDYFLCVFTCMGFTCTIYKNCLKKTTNIKKLVK